MFPVPTVAHLFQIEGLSIGPRVSNAATFTAAPAEAKATFAQTVGSNRMDVLDLADDVIDIAKKMVPLVAPGAGPAIAAAEAILALGKKVRPDLLYQDAARLTATLDELADRTAASLRK